MSSNNKRKRDDNEGVTHSAKSAVTDEREGESDGIGSDEETQDPKEQQVYIILDGAQLETVKTKKGDYQLLNCDDHIQIMKRHGKDPQCYRPDIIHQVHNPLLAYFQYLISMFLYDRS